MTEEERARQVEKVNAKITGLSEYYKTTICSNAFNNIDDMAVIRAIEDKREATKELINTGEGILVYHTGNEEIIVEIRNIKGYRGIV